MSDRPTPDTDAASWVETNQANALTLASFSSQLERERDEALELARELRDALTAMQEYYRQHIIQGSLFLQVHAALTKAKEVLP